MASIKYGASWKSNVNRAANVPVVVISPAANVRGAYVWRCSAVNVLTGAFMFVSLVAKNSAPTSVVDGDVLASVDGMSYEASTVMACAKLESPIYIEPGKGLYLISSSATSYLFESVLYDLL